MPLSLNTTIKTILDRSADVRYRVAELEQVNLDNKVIGPCLAMSVSFLRQALILRPPVEVFFFETKSGLLYKFDSDMLHVNQ